MTSDYNFMGVGQEVRDQIPPRPWSVERYGFSLAQIRDANGIKVMDQLNFAIAEFIVEKINE